MEKAYAQALLNAITDGMKPELAVTSMHAFIVKEGRTALLPAIARTFSELASVQQSRDVVEVVIGDSMDEVKAVKEVLAALGQVGIENVFTKVRYDQTLIGGWRAQTKDLLLDNSFKSHLVSLFRASTETI